MLGVSESHTFQVNEQHPSCCVIYEEGTEIEEKVKY